MATPKPKELTREDYERLGREAKAVLVDDYIQTLHSTPRQIWGSFVRGIFGGLGGVIGATLGVALLVFLLQHFGGLPVVGDFFRHLAQQLGTRPH